LRLVVLAVGRLKAGPERDLAARYRERADAAGRALGLPPTENLEIDEARAARAPERIADEGARLLAHPSLAGAALVAFDERGRSDLASEEFAERLRRWRDGARPALVMAVGGADGLAEPVRARADLVLAFGRLTLPHQLVRVLALEQLYRAMTILTGHPYHRGDQAGR
jgi:23S rRNA (pseudouridine1915-N3)-methyltransferase